MEMTTANNWNATNEWPFHCAFSPNPAGNWSPSDFPPGTTYDPYPDTHQSINRDLLVVMNNPDIVKTFQAVFDNDWATGKEWVPKY